MKFKKHRDIYIGLSFSIEHYKMETIYTLILGIFYIQIKRKR